MVQTAQMQHNQSGAFKIIVIILSSVTLQQVSTIPPMNNAFT